MFNLYMAPFSMDLVNWSYLKCQEKRQEKWTTFEATREATRKSHHILNVKRSDKKIAPHLKRQEKCHDTKLHGVLTKIYDDDDEVYDLPVISLCSLFGFVSLLGLRVVLVKRCSFAFAIIVFVRRLNLYVVLLSFASDMQLKISC